MSSPKAHLAIKIQCYKECCGALKTAWATINASLKGQKTVISTTFNKHGSLFESKKLQYDCQVKCIQIHEFLQMGPADATSLELVMS